MMQAAQRMDGSKDSQPLIELVDVHKSFGALHVLRGLSLQVHSQQTTVVIGESGSGKSVLIKLMNGLLLPDRGEVRLFGRNTKEVTLRELTELRRRVGTLFQNYALFDSMTVAENIAFPLEEHSSLTPQQIGEKVQGLLDFLGLADAGQLFPAELSGGMKKRVSLARALVSDPEVVLFDEPTTGLDPIMIEFVDQMLLDAKRSYHLTSLIISHDMASAFRLADRMAMLHHGSIVFEGTPEETRTTTVAPVQKFLQEGVSRLAAEQSDRGVEAAAQAGGVEGISLESLPQPAVEPVVWVRQLEKSFGARRVLNGINFYILPQQITTLIGGSGSGKSVCMKHILGLFHPDKGSVTVLGREVATLRKSELLSMRRQFGMLFQGAALFDSMTVEENVAFPLREQRDQRLSEKQLLERVHEVLEKLHILEIAPRMPADVSAGQRKRVGLARAIVTNPKIMIYDEPTTGLDPVMTSYVNDMIVEAQETFEVTSLVVSHDMASTFRISHRVAMLYQGHIIAFGTPAELQASQDPRVREFIYAGAWQQP